MTGSAELAEVLAFGILGLQLTLLLPNLVSLAAGAVLAAGWAKLPPAVTHSPFRGMHF